MKLTMPTIQLFILNQLNSIKNHLQTIYVMSVIMLLSFLLYTNFNHITAHNIALFLLVIALYFFGHVFRIIRLNLLLIGSGNDSDMVTKVHAITALPSALLPFKIGELIRLGSFFYLANSRVNVLQVWLMERYFDITILSGIIILLAVFSFTLPEELIWLLGIFIFSNIIFIVLLITSSNLLIYLKRYFIFKSTSKRGLLLLKYLGKVTIFQQNFKRLVEGRILIYFIITIFIWCIDLCAVFLIFRYFNESGMNISDYIKYDLINNINIDHLFQLNAHGLMKVISLAVLGITILAIYHSRFYVKNE